ncbi:MAG TPA: hypothetical protein VFG11_02690 [Acidobacteriota bacterium]|nr:hypothetical protein [Acidobacteriota bacterium]
MAEKDPYRRYFVAALAISALVQIILASLPDTLGDVLSYRDWMRSLVQFGIVKTYSNPELARHGMQLIYPPFIPYVLWLIGKIWYAVAPDQFLHQDGLVEFTIKTVCVAANLGISTILFWALKRSWESKIAFFAASAYAFNPAILFDTAYWGQTDSLSAIWILVAVILIVGRQPELAWTAISVGVMAKPFAWPFALLIGLYTFREFKIKRWITSAISALVAFHVLFWPWIRIHQLHPMLENVIVQIDASPYVSANAHNLWWLLQGGLPFRNVNDVAIAGISYKTFGIILLAIFLSITSVKMWKSKKYESFYFACASVAFGFFILSTHMHENHLFTFFPLMTLIFFRTPTLKRIYVLLSITFFLNLTLHDPALVHLFGRLNLRPQLALSPPINHSSPIVQYFLEQGRSFAIEERTGTISLARFILTILNAQVNVLIFAYWILRFYRDRGFDSAFESGEVGLRVRPGWVLVLILATGVPIVAMALHRSA